MFLLALVSILQLTFLPGHLVVRAARLPVGGLAHVLVALPVSLLLNHLAVVVMVALHAYVPATLYTIVAIELVGAAVLTRRAREHGGDAGGDAERLAALAEHVRSAGALRATAWWTFAWLAGLVLIAFVAVAAANVGTVFTQWDAVVSWNRWATSWAGNAFPTLTWHYPQLVPTSVSLTYVMTGRPEVQLFAKAAMGIFPVAPLLMLADLAVRRRNAAYLAALVVLGAVNWFSLRPFLFAGYADLPVAFMVLASLYVLVLLGDASDARVRRSGRVLAVLVGAGAALTKQGGILWAAAVVIIAALEAADELRAVGAPLRDRAARAIRVGVALAGVALLVAGPWYVYKSLQVRAGKDEDERGGIAVLSRHLTYRERADKLYAYLLDASSAALVNAVLPAVVAGALLSRRSRRPALLYGIPHVAICVGMTSYDLRNLAPAWPVLITAGCVGWSDALGSLSRRARLAVPSRLRWSPIALGGAVAASLVVAVMGQDLSEPRLRQVDGRERQAMGDRQLNAALQDFRERGWLRGKVITNYQLMRFLPALADLYVYDEFEDLKNFHAHVEEPENRYVLAPLEFIPGRESVRDAVAAGVAGGRFREILRTAQYRLLEISERRP